MEVINRKVWGIFYIYVGLSAFQLFLPNNIIYNIIGYINVVLTLLFLVLSFMFKDRVAMLASLIMVFISIVFIINTIF